MIDYIVFIFKNLSTYVSVYFKKGPTLSEG